MPLIPKQRHKRLSSKEILGKYQEWYRVKFVEEAPLTDEIYIKSFGHIVYAKMIIALYAIFKYNIDSLLSYCEFIFKSWSSTSGTGATIRYFPNWLASQAMVDQYYQSIKTARVKKKTESHPTYSDHEYIGKSKDVTFVPGEVMDGSESVYRN
jgi:hypothetical protein